jgi:hypothetical protein
MELQYAKGNAIRVTVGMCVKNSESIVRKALESVCLIKIFGAR